MSLREEVASRSTQGYSVALLYVNKELVRLQSDPNAGNAVMEARVVRAEVLQKMGDLVGCESELKRIVVTKLTPLSCQGYLLIKAKLLMQRGEVKESSVALQALRDRLGEDSAGEINKTYLWRQAFTLGVLSETRQAVRLADEHRASVDRGGFHDANNIIYTRILPALAAGDNISYSWRKWIDEIRGAGQLYLSSEVDFAGRLGNRGKSLCQALLAEAFVRWILGNRFDGYRVGFTAVLLLKVWNLGMYSEGVGEMVGALDDRAEGLVAALRVVFGQNDNEPISYALSKVADSANAEAAFAEATDIATLTLATGQVQRIYELLDDRS